MARGDARLDVLLDGARDIGGAAEAGVRIGNDGSRGVEAGHHRTALDEVVHSSDGEIRHSETRGGSCGTTLVQASETGLEGTTRTDTIAYTRRNLE